MSPSETTHAAGPARASGGGVRLLPARRASRASSARRSTWARGRWSSSAGRGGCARPLRRAWARASGSSVTRTGRRFFDDAALERGLLDRAAHGDRRSRLLVDELETDWVCLDCELMPWSAKAQELAARAVRRGRRGRAALSLREAVGVLAAAVERGPRGRRRCSTAPASEPRCVDAYRAAYRRYCWPVGIARRPQARAVPPAGERGRGARRQGPRSGTWRRSRRCVRRMTELLRRDAVPPRRRDGRGERPRRPSRWWEELTGRGGEGMVVKPLDFVARGSRGLAAAGGQVPRAGVPADHLRPGIHARRRTSSGCARAGSPRSARSRCASSRSASRRSSASSAASRCAASTSASSACWRWRASRSIRGCSCCPPSRSLRHRGLIVRAGTSRRGSRRPAPLRQSRGSRGGPIRWPSQASGRVPTQAPVRCSCGPRTCTGMRFSSTKRACARGLALSTGAEVRTQRVATTRVLAPAPIR